MHSNNEISNKCKKKKDLFELFMNFETANKSLSFLHRKWGFNGYEMLKWGNKILFLARNRNQYFSI